mmetsp:Transcript_8265/g.20833  ORF Transcript_8265/g.20833 Transcript_8265/m.20833 type:complete len:409 (-) Transcript_8265:154-1380(-)|eukprot:CAMPEP_0117517774 /NCGR_PEP_ID=MMETSP0784-20121206/31786_1 /TAXON_ID=39447 /ORGANISM="" /LENGTH=408 /DNA_ID=CAMNT_0005313667 /DNA_START=48 /DNA_END=1274 /DNA_ORIENTATION=-
MPAQIEATKVTRVLHLIGSPTSKFYFDLSILYGRTCTEFEGLDRKAYDHMYAVVYPSGKWGFPEKLDDTTVAATTKEALPIGAAMAKIEAMQPPVDVVMPHMFCLAGMTHFRGLCETFGIEVLGCSAQTCAVGQDKFLTKAVCKAAGVPVPDGEMVRKDEHGADTSKAAAKLLEKWTAPLIVKPAREDNSIGLSLVRNGSVEEVAAALSKGFKYDDLLLVEEYIAGRECRVGVLEVEDGDGGVRLVILPKLEYILEDIREQKHKLGTDASGSLLGNDANPAAAIDKAKEEGERICPAVFEPEVHARLDDLAIRAHKALDCKYYSLYDVRIDKDGRPFMLEACLFCSFSPHSVIVNLAGKASDSELQPHPKIFENLLRRAALETHARRAALADEHEVPTEGGVKKRKVA